MKKIFAILVVAVLALTAVFALVACDDNKSEVEKAIAAAQKMTLEELEAAAKAEFDANPDAVFQADSLTSGVKKAVAAMQEKYDWFKGNYNSKKGALYQPVLSQAQKANAYVADFVMIQDASFVQSMADAGFLLSFVPQGDEFDFDQADTNPMVSVTFNKVFMWNSSEASSADKDHLKNVWQMTGVASADGSLQPVDVSYQSPLGEDINLNFLIMMTSPAACEKLAAAYKTYFGKDYDGKTADGKDDGYLNIGYKFVNDYIKSVKYWHGSDTDEVKAIGGYNDGRVVFAGLCKFKDYPGFTEDKATANNVPYYKTGMTAGGWNTDIAGFNGYIYNMYANIPVTAKMPYTACLFTRYILSEDGFNAGFGGILGYYSANKNISSVDGDPALTEWKTKTLVEDADYINSVYNTAVKFINRALSGK